MATINVNGTRLFYEISGTSAARAVLVHGSWGDHHNWDSVVPALARDFTVLTYDRRGHSQSEGSATHGTLQQDADDLAALVEELGFAPLHVIGNSFGASTVLRLAGERPDLFQSLTAHEPPLFALLGDDPASQQPLAELNRRVAAVVDLLRAREAVAGAERFVNTIAFGPGAWETLPEAMRQTFIGNAYTWLDELDDPEWNSVDLSILARFNRPALLTEGDQSPPFFPAVVARVAGALPGAARHVFTGAGHVPHVTIPETYVRTVTGFIAGAASKEEPAPRRGFAPGAPQTSTPP